MCGDYNLRREKRYVEVDVRFTPDGKIRPLAIYQKIEGCSGILQVKCNRCKETLRLDLAFRCR